MKNIIRVEIMLYSTTYIRELIFIDNTVAVNGTVLEFDKNKFYDLFSIIRNWNHEYVDENNIEGEEFYINIYKLNGIDYFHGKGKYPSNYLEFKEWVRNICGE